MGSASVVPEENVISAIRSASGSNLPTNSIAAACTAGKAPSNDPDRSMTKDMSTSRRVAVASADTLTVSADATATRRLVDMSFVIDRSGSLLGAFPAVQAAAMEFVGKFDPEADRIALITFSSGTTLAEPMGSARGFDLAQI